MARSRIALLSGSGTTSVSLTATNVEYKLIYVHAIVTTSATVGNRLYRLELLDAALAVVGDWHMPIAVAASQANKHIEYMQGIYRESAFDVQGSIQIPFPNDLVILDGYTLRFRDSAAISASDSISLYVQVLKQAA